MGTIEPRRYAIAELAELAGVSRRTVRYYVVEGLLPAPEGTGRGDHYTEAHLERLVRIRQLQENGVPLAEIREELDGRAARTPSRGAPVTASSWARLRLADDLEMHIRTTRLGPWLLEPEDVARIDQAVRTALARQEKENGR